MEAKYTLHTDLGCCLDFNLRVQRGSSDSVQIQSGDIILTALSTCFSIGINSTSLSAVPSSSVPHILYACASKNNPFWKRHWMRTLDFKLYTQYDDVCQSWRGGTLHIQGSSLWFYGSPTTCGQLTQSQAALPVHSPNATFYNIIRFSFLMTHFRVPLTKAQPTLF